MHSILRQQAAQFVAVGGCGCLSHSYCISTIKIMDSQYMRTNLPTFATSQQVSVAVCLSVCAIYCSPILR